MQLSRVLKCNSIFYLRISLGGSHCSKLHSFCPLHLPENIMIPTEILSKLKLTNWNAYSNSQWLHPDHQWSKVLCELSLLTVLTQMRGRAWRVETTGVMTVSRSARMGSRGQSGAQEGGDCPCLQHWWPSQTTQARCQNHKQSGHLHFKWERLFIRVSCDRYLLNFLLSVLENIFGRGLNWFWHLGQA